MGSVFLKLLNLSITASWLILAIIIVRLLLIKAPKWIRCALWALVAVRLLCPFSLESIFSLIPNSEPVPQNIAMESSPAINSGIPLVNDVINPVISAHFTPSLEDSMNPLQIVEFVASIVWLIGMLTLLLYAVISYARLKKSVGASISIGKNILACDDVKSPFILGIFKPFIYVPSSMNGEVFDYVVLHERAHIKRKDYLWKPLGFLFLSVYWFNPLCWVAYTLLCRDIEMACDEKVIRDMDKEEKAAYSEALLDCSFSRKLIAACPVAFGEVGVKKRVKTVLNYRKPAFWILCISILLCIVIGICFLTNPKTPSKKLLADASPETSAMSFYYFDGENTTIKWLYNGGEERQIINEINALKTKQEDCSRIADMMVPCYGLEIVDRDGYDIWLTYSNGLWLLKDGSIYSAKYDFEKLFSEMPEENMDICTGGIYMTNAALLGEYDIRFYQKMEYSEAAKNGVDLSVISYSDNKVTVRLQNNSEESFCFGEYFTLQKEINNSWYTLPVKLSNYGFTDIGYILEAGESAESVCDLTMYGEIGDGHYRIEKEGLLADFMISGDIVSQEVEVDVLPETEVPEPKDGDAIEKETEGDLGENDASESVRHSDYTEDFLFDFGGIFYLSDSYKAPVHGAGTPIAWYALGGEGKCIGTSFQERETFCNGRLTEYRWIDNHSLGEKIKEFSVGGYSCCLYQYTFDLFTAAELSQQQAEKTTSAYWVVFYTEGEDKPLYLKYFNCDYFTQEKAMENILPGRAIMLIEETSGSGQKIEVYQSDYESYVGVENMGVSYVEDPETHHYIVDGDMVFRYKLVLVGQNPTAVCPIQYIILTNDKDVTWEQVESKLISSSGINGAPGIILLGINALE